MLAEQDMIRQIHLFFLLCVSHVFPQDVSQDVESFKIWRCNYRDVSTVRGLEDDVEISVLFHDAHTVHFASSSSESVLMERAVAKLHVSNCSVVQSASVQEELHSLHKRSAATEDEWFTRYHNLTSIYSWYNNLAVEHPLLVRTTALGITQRGNSIMAVHIASDNETKPIVYIQCLLHAREWITGPVCAYISWYLVQNEHQDPEVALLLSKLEFVIVPMANPDGYELTWTDYPKYRFWRKNVSHKGGTSCFGVDLNRNFDVNWSQHGASSEPCGETYHGPLAGSEIETAAIVDLLKNNKDLIVGAVDFHAFSQKYLIGWTTREPDKVERLRSVTRQVALAASGVGKMYTSQQMGDVYLASGTFTDWLYQENGNTIPLTVELRPTVDASSDYSGFMVPAKEILPTCKEIVPAIKKFCFLLLEMN